MVYEYEEAMEASYIASLVKAFKKNITDGYFNFIILDCINEKIADYDDMWSFAKTKGFRVRFYFLLNFILHSNAIDCNFIFILRYTYVKWRWMFKYASNVIFTIDLRMK